MVFFFFKQKTAYEMRISDWSSDVCSSDLCPKQHYRFLSRPRGGEAPCGAASACRIDLFDLRRERSDAFPRNRQGRSSGLLLRCPQKGHRGHGAQLCASLECPDHDVPLLPRIRPLGAPTPRTENLC